MKKVKILIIVLLLPFLCFGQEEEKKYRIYGYVKDMVTYNFSPPLSTNQVDNLIHNRLNFSWFPTDQFSTQVEIRTRLFTGDQVKAFPNYSTFIDGNNDFADLSWIPVDENSVVLHTMIDRAYLNWKRDKWSLRVGRQRINWGVNMVWNPNDIFNAYNFFDFDYEERPGSDAVRFQRYIGYAGGIEVAFKITDDWDDFTGAAMYKWNIWNYDMQLLTGKMRDSWIIGTGWAGNIGLAGFKGEFTYFTSKDENQLLGSVSVDYSFANSLYLNASALYNSSEPELSTIPLQSTSNLDVRSLSPYKWSTFLQASYNFHPLVNGGLSMLYFINEPGTFLSPFVTWSVVENLDLDFIGQFYLNGQPQEISIAYVRLKYSF